MQIYAIKPLIRYARSMSEVHWGDRIYGTPDIMNTLHRSSWWTPLLNLPPCLPRWHGRQKLRRRKQRTMTGTERLTRPKERPVPSKRVRVTQKSQGLMTLFLLLTTSRLTSNTISIGASRAGRLRWFPCWLYITILTTIDRNWRRDRYRFDYWDRSCSRASRTGRTFDQLLPRGHCHLYCDDCLGRDELLFAITRRFQRLYIRKRPNSLTRRCLSFRGSCSWIFSWMDILAQVCNCHVCFHTLHLSNSHRPNQ